MSDYSNWFQDKQRGGQTVGQIKEQVIYQSLSSEIVQKIEDNLPANQIINWIREQARNTHVERYGLPLQVGALNKVSGTWNEFMVTTAFSEIAIDINNSSKESTVVIFPLPNTQISSISSNHLSSRFLSLFKQSAFDKCGELHQINAYKHQIFFSSPDYIIASLKRDQLNDAQVLLSDQARRPNDDLIYARLRGELNSNEVKAAVSVKTEYRPDRRYQPLFEADLVKQLARATGQDWKFYMVSSKETSSDTSVFERITTPDAYENNYKLVDGSFLFLRKADLIPLVEAAIS